MTKENRTERLNARITPEVKRKAEVLADAYGLSIASLIAILINQEYRKFKSPSI